MKAKVNQRIRSLSRPTAAMLDKIEYAHFKYFVKNQSRNGLIRDRSTAYSPASVAAVGFALTIYPVAAERGWITRGEAAAYAHLVMSTLLTAPQGPQLEGNSGHWGFFYHYLDGETAERACDLKFWPQIMHFFEVPPPRIDVELSTIDTTLLMAGVLFAKNYFRQDNPRERSIRELAAQLYNRVEWDRMLTKDNLMSMGWKPEVGFLDAKFFGMTEALLLYILAMGSPTHPIPASTWQTQLAGVTSSTHYGETIIHMADSPMFGYVFPLCWLDLAGIKDDLNRRVGFDYFTNAARVLKIQQSYAIENPHGYRGYGKRYFGFSAGDGPGDYTITVDGVDRTFNSYGVRGAPDGPDDGTLYPHAVAASLPLAPRIVLPTLAYWEKHSPELLTPTGYTDAFNPTANTAVRDGWKDRDQLGIDQGQIGVMIANYRDRLVWETMRRETSVRDGLRLAGFKGGWLENRATPHRAKAAA